MVNSKKRNERIENLWRVLVVLIFIVPTLYEDMYETQNIKMNVLKRKQKMGICGPILCGRIEDKFYIRKLRDGGI